MLWRHWILNILNFNIKKINLFLNLYVGFRIFSRLGKINYDVARSHKITIISFIQIQIASFYFVESVNGTKSDSYKSDENIKFFRYIRLP